MMTEQRAIDLLKGILPKKVSYAQMICASNCYGDEMVYQEPEPYAIEFAINSIQENSKLKAEIERLNGKSEMYRDMADSFCESNIKLKAEIEQLKHQIETRIKVSEANFNIYSKLEIERDNLVAEIEQLKEDSKIIAKELVTQIREIDKLKSELKQCKNRQAISEKERMIQGLNDFCDKFEMCNQCIFYGRCADFDELSFEEIKSQLEEAEQSLKGQV